MPPTDKKPLVGDGDERIDLAFKLSQAVLRLEIPHFSFKGEGLRHDGNGEGAHFFRYLGDDRRCPRAGPAAQTAREEDHVGAFEGLGDLFRVFKGRLPPDLGVRPCAETPRQFCAYLDLDGRLVRVEGLDVGIHRDELHALETRLHHVVDGVAAAAADAHNLQLRRKTVALIHIEHAALPQKISSNIRFIFPIPFSLSFLNMSRFS